VRAYWSSGMPRFSGQGMTVVPVEVTVTSDGWTT